MKTQIRSISFIFSLLFIALCFILSNCDEEKPQFREYPRVNTLPVSNITEEGATFNADLYSIGTETIMEYGFIWGWSSNPTIWDDKKVLPDIPLRTGNFSAEIRSTLVKGTNYTVKPYIKTEEHVVYGKPVTFASLGSLAPEITGFKPDSAAWNDTLIIRGKNFSWVPSKNIVRLNQLQCVTINSNDTLLRVRVPIDLTEKKTTISVELSGMVATYNEKFFTLILPQITGIYPLRSYWNDTLIIRGRNFCDKFAPTTS